MALINCTECKKEISDKATACPGCGAPIKKSDNSEVKEVSDSSGMSKSTSALIGFILGFMVVVISCGTNHVDYISRASITGGCILGSLFAILGSLLGSNKNK